MKTVPKVAPNLIRPLANTTEELTSPPRSSTTTMEPKRTVASPSVVDEMQQESMQHRELTGEVVPPLNTTAKATDLPRSGPPDFVVMQVSGVTAPKFLQEPERHTDASHGYKLGQAQTPFAIDFDKNWGNRDGVLDAFEASMHWASYSLNELWGSHVRMTLQPKSDVMQWDMEGAVYIRFDEAVFRKEYLEPLFAKGAPDTMRTYMGIMLEIAAPHHLKKLYGRSPTRQETLSLVAKTLARRRVPIADYLKSFAVQGTKSALADMRYLEQAYKLECNLYGWHP